MKSEYLLMKKGNKYGGKTKKKGRKKGRLIFSFCGPDRLQRTPLPQQIHIKRKEGGTKVVIRVCFFSQKVA